MLNCLAARRNKFRQYFTQPAAFWSGSSPAINYPGNTYPFRASSHFLFFAGQSIENAVFYIDNNRTILFMDEPSTADQIWHGEVKSRKQIAQNLGIDEHYSLTELSGKVGSAVTIPLSNLHDIANQEKVLGKSASNLNAALALAIVETRLAHDTYALQEMRTACKTTITAHKKLMQNLKKIKSEAQARSILEAEYIANNMSCAYNSIVSVQGEVLHNHSYVNSFTPGDLLLVDSGAESATGYASDVTRTLPINGKYSASQRAIYEIVYAAHMKCLDNIKPGIEYADLHLLASQTIAQGLIDVGLLHGNANDLVEIGAHAMFFPHGVGHLLGLDVHDMEDLGDIAGYAQGRKRSNQFGLNYLRLNRTLQENMAVTVEPGIYFIPALLNNAEYKAKFGKYINYDKLINFKDVRGIRLENDIILTKNGFENLTVDIPLEIGAVENLINF